MRTATLGRLVAATLLFLAGAVLAAAGALTVYFRDPLKTTLVLLGAAAVCMGAAWWVARRR